VRAKEKYTIDFIKKNNLVLLEAISGSQAYGTNTPTSDTDLRGIFIMSKDDYLGLDYVEQVSDEKNDTTYYEIGRFLTLLLTNNPNLLELLNVPSDCLLYRHPLMDLIKQEDFISKLCKNSFGGYATEQIRKARGLNKKIVNPIAKEKKTPLDFCYIIDGYGSKPIKGFLEEKNMEQRFCGIVNIEHARDVYALFYDQKAHNCFSENISEEERERIKSFLRNTGDTVGLGYKGIEVDNSNTIRVSSIPKGETQLATISYNKDGYTKYSKDYHDYWKWTENRNEERFNLSSKQGFDHKNMLHCFRLTEMAMEIASGQGIIVRRPNRDYLMKIRNGEIEYDELLKKAEENLKKADSLFNSCSLQKFPSFNNADIILKKIRNEFYK
jgi:predicted nucleotidyltransferase